MTINRVVIKLGGTILFLLMIVILPLGFVMNQIFSAFYSNHLQEEIGNLAERYAAAVAERRDPMTVGMIEMMSAFSDIKVLITDAQGGVIGNSGVPWREELPISDADRAQLRQGNSVRLQLTDPVSGERFLTVGEPIIDAGRYFGSVFVFSSVNGLDQSLFKIQQLLALSSLGAFFLAIGFTVVVSRKLSNPLIEMEQATRSIAKGDLETRVTIPSKDEVGSLARAINDLAVELQRYRDTRSEFLANVSHELRTPLTYLEGYSKVLKEELYETEEEKHKYLDIIHQETVRLSHLVHDLFELSKMEEGKISLQMEWIDLTELARNAVQKVEPKAEKKGVRLTFSQSGRIPLVFADGLRMEQVLMNLLDNAIRYTERGSIRLELLDTGEGIKAVVEDTGVGIPAEELPHIFERFYRVEKSRSRVHGGTGLGLSIVKQLVEIQGGAISVTSKVHHGTRFEITLPKGGNEP